MNVSLAAQTVSSSVTDALQYLKDVDNSFANVDATIKFIRIFYRSFNVPNVRSIFGRGYKVPWLLKNQSLWEIIFKDSEEYMKTLKVGVSIFQHSRKTFAIGFLMNTISLSNLAIYFF